MEPNKLGSVQFMYLASNIDHKWPIWKFELSAGFQTQREKNQTLEKSSTKFTSSVLRFSINKNHFLHKPFAGSQAIADKFLLL
jgi:hypothetical protein